MDERLLAKPDLINGKWRILTMKDGLSLHVGRSINNGLLMEYIEYDTEEEALNFIKSDDRLKTMMEQINAKSKRCN